MKISLVSICASFVLSVKRETCILQAQKERVEKKEKKNGCHLTLRFHYFDANRFSYQEIVRGYIVTIIVIIVILIIVVTVVVIIIYSIAFYFFYVSVNKYFTVNMQTFPQGSSSGNFSRRQKDGSKSIDISLSLSLSLSFSRFFLRPVHRGMLPKNLETDFVVDYAV